MTYHSKKRNDILARRLDHISELMATNEALRAELVELTNERRVLLDRIVRLEGGASVAPAQWSREVDNTGEA